MNVHPDLSRARELAAENGGALGRPMHLLACTTSTNDVAKQAARAGAPHGSTWVAEEQTAGRGRRGHEWLCPRGEGLLFSVLLRLTCAPPRIPPLALAAGLAVRDAVARAAPAAEVGVKWPNDVVIAGRKVAGVLVEGVMTGARLDALVVGVGLNVHTRVFPALIAARATSVALASETPPDRARLLADVLVGLDRDVQVVAARGLGLLLARMTAADVLRGRRVRRDADDGADDPPSRGTAEGIDADGRLTVRRDDGILIRWNAGEVHLAP